jgi:hypothetical protein
MPRPRVSHYRVVVSGRTVEVYAFSKPIGYNLGLKKNNASINERTKNPKIHPSAMARTRKNVIRLTNANAFQWKDIEEKIIPTQFVSLTFKKNETNIDYANQEYTNFIKRINYHYFGTTKSVTKYLTVIEFQERGAVHYHTLYFNLPTIDLEAERKTRQFANIWGHGFVDIIPVYSNNVGMYLAKYMTKNIDARLIGRRRYFSSRGLKKPVVISHEHMAHDLACELGTHEIPVFHSNYRSNVTGVTTYAVYELKDVQLQHYFEGYNL